MYGWPRVEKRVSRAGGSWAKEFTWAMMVGSTEVEKKWSKARREASEGARDCWIKPRTQAFVIVRISFGDR